MIIGFLVINGGEVESLSDSLFDVPSKEREEEIIKYMSEDLKKTIDIIIDIELK